MVRPADHEQSHLAFLLGPIQDLAAALLHVLVYGANRLPALVDGKVTLILGDIQDRLKGLKHLFLE